MPAASDSRNNLRSSELGYVGSSLHIRSGETMTRLRVPPLLMLALFVLLGGCATRPINPPITQTDPTTGYSFEARQGKAKDTENLVVLAFSGGGTRAAAFSYGVLEFLRKTEVVGPKGNKVRLLDSVNIITGVSGGSFTALAYGLYGDKLFDDYEQALPEARRAGRDSSHVS